MTLHVVSIFQLTRSLCRRPPQVNLLFPFIVKTPAFLTSSPDGSSYCLLIEASEQPLFFSFPTANSDVGTEKASCLSKMEEYTYFLDRIREGFEKTP